MGLRPTQADEKQLLLVLGPFLRIVIPTVA
jgi:hypothetical protein